MELHNRGYRINHKTVHRLMQFLKLKCIVRIKKVSFVQGRNLKSDAKSYSARLYSSGSNPKWTADITEFSLLNTKIYLSPILDSEIISYNISERPVLGQVTDMLGKVCPEKETV